MQIQPEIGALKSGSSKNKNGKERPAEMVAGQSRQRIGTTAKLPALPVDADWLALPSGHRVRCCGSASILVLGRSRPVVRAKTLRPQPGASFEPDWTVGASSFGAGL